MGPNGNYFGVGVQTQPKSNKKIKIAIALMAILVIALGGLMFFFLKLNDTVNINQDQKAALNEMVRFAVYGEESADDFAPYEDEFLNISSETTYIGSIIKSNNNLKVKEEVAATMLKKLENFTNTLEDDEKEDFLNGSFRTFYVEMLKTVIVDREDLLPMVLNAENGIYNIESAYEVTSEEITVYNYIQLEKEASSEIVKYYTEAKQKSCLDVEKGVTCRQSSMETLSDYAKGVSLRADADELFEGAFESAMENLYSYIEKYYGVNETSNNESAEATK